MPDYGLGFDTGGTYTDAVIIDMANGKVICCAKSLTTRYDLSVGIEGAIKGFDKELFMAVSPFLCEIDVSLIAHEQFMATISDAQGCGVVFVTIAQHYTMEFSSYICRNGSPRTISQTRIHHFLVMNVGQTSGDISTRTHPVRTSQHGWLYC